MFNCEQEPLALLIELTPKAAKKRYRQSIYFSWDNECAYCGELATSLDHIVPKFRSGHSNRNNLIPACKRCNSNKASSNIEEWFLKQDFFNQARMNKIKSWMKQEPVDIFYFKTDSVA
jgi:hypothetical protein